MKLLKKTLKYIGLFFLALVSYLIAVIAISFVSVNNSNPISNEKNEIEIFILSNGVHTDIVVPVKNKFYDWTTKIKYNHTKSKDTIAQFLAIGWGDRSFYLETPTWGDLKCSTALKAATGLSSSAMHTTFYKSMKEDEYCKKIKINADDYKKLVVYINDSFQTKSNENQKIETNSVYGKNDIFYEAKGSYSLFYTCNSWANQALKSANQKAALWTILDSGIFSHYQ